MPAGVSVVNTANAFLNVLRGGGVGATFTAPAVQSVRLHIGDPGPAGANNGANGDVNRKDVTFAAANGGSMSLSSAAPVWNNAAATEQLQYISVWSATSGGVFQYSAALASPQNWQSGNTFTLVTLTVSITPLAT